MFNGKLFISIQSYKNSNHNKGTRQKKKKIVENSTFGGGPDPGIFHISKKKKKWCLKCILSHFKPF